MENWRDIPGFEGRYQASDLGRVRSVTREVRAVSKAGNEYFRRITTRVLRPGLCRGYPIVNVSKAGAPWCTVAVHLLVARTWLPGAGEDVNHVDGVKQNTAVSNLEWLSHQGNLLHAVAHGLNTQAVRVRHPVTGEVFASIRQAAQACRCRASAVREWERT